MDEMERLTAPTRLRFSATAEMGREKEHSRRAPDKKYQYLSDT
jgi:hypothetical protein